MKKYLVLILSGAAGYIAYPVVVPALLGTKKKPSSSEASEAATEMTKPEPKQADKAPVAVRPEPKVAKPASFGIAAKIQNEAEIPDLPVQPEPKVAPKVEPDTPDAPEEQQLTSVDFEKIITQEVETGKFILFRKNNIIEWKLLDQQLEAIDGKYEGVVTVETVNLFGKSTRKAQITIVDTKIRNWHWVEEKE